MKFENGARGQCTTMASMVLLFRSGLDNLHAAASKFAWKPEQNKELFITRSRFLGPISSKDDSKLKLLENWGLYFRV